MNLDIIANHLHLKAPTESCIIGPNCRLFGNYIKSNPLANLCFRVNVVINIHHSHLSESLHHQKSLDVSFGSRLHRCRNSSCRSSLFRR
ncbi:hypothetical protein HanPI659440_Chr12g0449491 [Helianthus annuus]|nr:hypothetical protein HanPI659440_Chr12g0449491 [Helianthus annuus]